MSIKQEILHYSRQENIAPLSHWFDYKLEQLVDTGTYSDLNTLEDTGRKLIAELKNYSKKYKINNAVIGMSGGVDSALTASMFKQAGWNVTAITLPIHQNQEETDRAINTCTALGIECQQIDLTKAYDELLKDFKKHDPDITRANQALRRGNLRVRLRMMTLYNQASAKRALVASTDNFSELAAGFWTLHGDVGDLAPIQCLNKSWEVPKLAELYDVPAETVFATPTDGLGVSNGDEDQFGFSYLEFDIILLTLCQLKHVFHQGQIETALEYPAEDAEKVQKILNRIRMSSFKRSNPYNLAHPQYPERYVGLAALDTVLWDQQKKENNGR